MDKMNQEKLEFLKCIANETRLEILELLCEKEHNVQEIIEKLDKEQSLISHHLKSLRECDLVKKERSGKKRVYKIASDELEEFLEEVENLSRCVCKK